MLDMGDLKSNCKIEARRRAIAFHKWLMLWLVRHQSLGAESSNLGDLPSMAPPRLRRSRSDWNQSSWF